MDSDELKILTAAVTGAAMAHGKSPVVADLADDAIAITTEVMGRILADEASDWLAYYSTMNPKELEKEAKRLRKIIHEAGPGDDVSEEQARLIAVEILLSPPPP